MVKNKFIRLLSAGLISLSVVGGAPVYAEDTQTEPVSETETVKAGWERTAEGTRYRLATGKYVKNQMRKIDGNYYYFDADGYMVKSQWVDYRNNRYLFARTGKRVVGWYTYEGEKYYLAKTGAMVKGWLTIGGKTYYLDEEDGHLHTDEWVGDKYVTAEGWVDPDAVPDKTLYAHFKVVDGVVKEVVSGKTLDYATVDEDGVHFKGDASTYFGLGQAAYNMTIEAVVDFDEANMNQSKTVFNTNDGVSGKIPSFTLVKNNDKSFGIKANRLAKNPYYSNVVSVDSTYVNEIKGTIEHETLTEGDTFVAISGDVTNKKVIAQVNGAQGEIELDAVKYYYRTSFGSICLNNTHRIKELKFYNTARTADELMSDYKKTKISKTVSSVIDGADGIVGLGSPYAVHQDEDGRYIWDEFALEGAGIYTGTYVDGSEKDFAMAEFDAAPKADVDNSVYESLHISNPRDEMYVGKQYSITAIPYPFEVSNNFDIVWESDNENVISCIDGLLVAHEEGTATITATLRGTDISDSFTITAVEAPEVEDIIFTVPDDYVSESGHTLNNSEDYQDSMWAIYDAIEEAHQEGCTHVVFPEDVYASAIERDLPIYYIPSNMTIEFTNLHMMYQDYYAKNHQFEVFVFGVPGNDYENYCENSKLIIENYYGERYEAGQAGTLKESDYIEEVRFAEFGRKAKNCTIEIHNAEYPAGYFIVVDGLSYDPSKETGVIKYSDMTTGRLNGEGNVVEEEGWISTSRLIEVPEQIKEDGYFLSADGQESHAGKYWRGCTARLYDIAWFDENLELIGIDRYQATMEYYEIPENAAYYSVSLNQGDLPTPGSKETTDSPWMAMHDNGAAVDCEIKDTYAFNTAAGLFSVVGECDGLWIHHNHTPSDGTKPGDERTGDLENGWHSMRHTVISNNVFAGKTFTAFASGGDGTFIHTNVFGNEIYTRPDDEQTRMINNRGTTFICAAKDTFDFYYNRMYNRMFNSSQASLKGWKCSGNLHENYNRYLD